MESNTYTYEGITVSEAIYKVISSLPPDTEIDSVSAKAANGGAIVTLVTKQ